MRLFFLLITVLARLSWLSESFGIGSMARKVRQSAHSRISSSDDKSIALDDTRRAFIATTSSVVTGSLLIGTSTPANAAVGTLPEFSETNAILQGLTVNVADKSQLDAMVGFLSDGFGFQILRQRIRGNIEDIWLGFGPEQLSIPSEFTIPVSSFSTYGGHASIHLQYDSQTKSPLYRIGDPAPGDNIAYLQVGVTGYRISKIVSNGGNILDAYGNVNVISPAGLPMRGIVGFVPDPMMFVAINCADVRASKAYYEQLGFVELDVPYARPSKGTTIFEPAPPKGSVYMAPSPNSMGVLLFPAKKKRLTPNPVVESLTIVYSPAEGSEGQEVPLLVDPSGVSIKFQRVSDFESEEKVTR